MFYYLYQITNNLNGKIYVGVHKTKDLDDGYMGSGKVINCAIKKYGVDNFTKVVLEMFDDAASMYAREKEIVTEEFLSRDYVYNLRRGGFGGFEYINNAGLNHKLTSADAAKGGNSLYELKRGWHSEETKKRAKDAQRAVGTGFFDPLVRDRANLCSQSDAARTKRKETLKRIGHQQGERHSQFGTKWITNGAENKKIKKSEEIPNGWTAGRKMKI